MTRNQILTALNDHHTTHYPPDVVERVASMISGTLAELDALPPYPSESDFQSQLTTVVYPFLAAAQALDMEGEDCRVLTCLIEEMFPQPAVMHTLPII
jgi:hypothetical protein